MTELEHYITSYFGIPNHALQEIQSRFKETKLIKDEFLVQEGQPVKQLSFIKTGALRVFKNEDKKEVTQWISSPGEFITDLSSLIFDTPSRWHIQALSECHFYTITISDYRSINEILTEWVQLEKLFIAKCFLSLEDRIYSFLSMTAEERYLAFIDNKGILLNEVPHHYLASMLGMTPETLSRIRRKIAS